MTTPPSIERVERSGASVARILAFPAVAQRETRTLSMTTAGELVAMRHIDLDTVVETIRFLRDIGRDHLLDSFNRRQMLGTAPGPATPIPCGNR